MQAVRTAKGWTVIKFNEKPPPPLQPSGQYRAMKETFDHDGEEIVKYSVVDTKAHQGQDYLVVRAFDWRHACELRDELNGGKISVRDMRKREGSWTG